MPHPDQHGPDATALGHLNEDDSLGAAKRLADGLADTLRMARALAASGRPVDLAGLAEPIGLLCAKSLDLPSGQGQQMRVKLIALLQEVDTLSDTLRTALRRSATPR